MPIAWKAPQRIKGIAKRLLTNSFAGRYLRLKPFNYHLDIFDTSLWSWLPPVTRDEYMWVTQGLPEARGENWLIPTPPETPDAIAIECLDEVGVFPLSFSLPDSLLDPKKQKLRQVARIIPGPPYTFTNQADYLSEYETSHFALTFRKGGWDCFRHLEIIGAGAIPIMIDARKIPRYSMIHYPKRVMVHVVEHVLTSGDLPTPELHSYFTKHLTTHQTSISMARYLLRMSKLENARRVLFVDQRLSSRVDYLSVMTLIGMKQLLGAQCIALPDPSYLYRDWSGSTSEFYGRGFGYTRVLDPSLRTERNSGASSRLIRRIRQDDFDALIVGSISRNGPLSTRLLAEFPAEKTIWVHGEDVPPSPRELHYMRDAKVNVFVRSVPDKNGGLPDFGDYNEGYRA